MVEEKSFEQRLAEQLNRVREGGCCFERLTSCEESNFIKVPLKHSQYYCIKNALDLLGSVCVAQQAVMRLCVQSIWLDLYRTLKPSDRQLN